MSEIITHRMTCGLTLLAQPIPNVASAALHWLLPAGSATDPETRHGRSTMLGEMIFRGAGGMSSREHSDALDRAGVQRSSSVQAHHLQIDATLLGDRLAEALPLLTAMVRSPALAEDAVEAVRSLCLQSLDGLDDDPQHLAMIRLREQHMPRPFGRHGYGERDVLETLSQAELADSWRERCVPHGSILAAAGAVDPDDLARRLDAQLEGWAGSRSEPTEAEPPRRGYRHFGQDTAQVHIGLAWNALRESDDNAMLERVAIAVLSGSTSGRLFTEVRQKRSLCYSVGASYRAGRDRGMVALYAGTTPDRAQETLDVSVAEVERLFSDAGADRDEFDRAIVGLKSHLIMMGESTCARAGSIAQDQFRLGRARTLDELAAAIDAITLDDLNVYVAGRSIGEITAVSIGPGELTPPTPSDVAVV